MPSTEQALKRLFCWLKLERDLRGSPASSRLSLSVIGDFSTRHTHQFFAVSPPPSLGQPGTRGPQVLRPQVSPPTQREAQGGGASSQ